MKHSVARFLPTPVVVVFPLVAGCGASEEDGGPGLVATGGVPPSGHNSSTGGSPLAVGIPAGGDHGTDGGNASTGGQPAREEIRIVNGLPAIAHCDPAATWESAWEGLEQAAVVELNKVRAAGVGCGSRGAFETAGPVEVDPFLTCAARLHAKHMVDNNYFSTVNPVDGAGVRERIAATGYAGSAFTESIGQNYASGVAVIEGWLLNEDICQALMHPAYDQVGVGYYPSPTFDGGATYASSRMWVAYLADSKG